MPERTASNKDAFTKSIRDAISAADQSCRTLDEWRVLGNRDAFDIDSFLERFGSKWHMPSKPDLFNGPLFHAGWGDVVGWRSSDSTLNVDLLMQDYDDHAPANYTVNARYTEMKPSVERRYLSRYYVRRKWDCDTIYSTQDGRIMTEEEYQSWRISNRIRW